MKRLILGVLIGGLLVVGAATPSRVWARGGGFHGHTINRGHVFHGERFHHGHTFFRGGVFIGAPLWWGGWGWGPPYPYDYYYGDPAVTVAPPTYVQPNPPQAPTYWYYCQQSQAYYPYVKECPGGWMTVVPPGSSPTPAQ